MTVLTWLLAFAFSSLQAQSVSRYAGNDSSLDVRWRWAVQEASRPGGGQEFWIGYSVKRLMSNNSYILSGNTVQGLEGTRRSLYDILSLDGRPDVKEMRHEEKGSRIFKCMKDIAVFFRFSRDGSKVAVLQNIELCTMELSIDLKHEPVYWLGSTDDNQSVATLKAMFDRESSVMLKKSMVEAIGIHQQSENVFPFLSGVLTGREPNIVRAQAAFWIGEQNSPKALDVLMEVAEKDSSLKVREQSVFALSRLDSDSSTEALITLARAANDTKIRGKAAFWLGHVASQKAVATLEDIVASDEETGVQRQALFGLSQMKDREGIDRLIRIATTHPNPRIRRQAIQLLGQSDDPKALDALIAIVRK